MIFFSVQGANAAYFPFLCKISGRLVNLAAQLNVFMKLPLAVLALNIGISRSL